MKQLINCGTCGQRWHGMTPCKQGYIDITAADLPYTPLGPASLLDTAIQLAFTPAGRRKIRIRRVSIVEHANV